VGVSEILKVCTRQTLELLEQELEIRKGELLEKLLFSSLEKIFIQNKIYRDNETCETFEEVVTTMTRIRTL
jgi:topoisomerase-4 subunit A